MIFNSYVSLPEGKSPIFVEIPTFFVASECLGAPLGDAFDAGGGRLGGCLVFWRIGGVKTVLISIFWGNTLW